MLWKTDALLTKEDFAEAMVEIDDPAEAQLFKARFLNAFPRRGEDLLGYLVGEIHPDESPRVAALLEVTHDPSKSVTGSVFVSLSRGIRMRQTDPELSDLIMAIPRENWDPSPASFIRRKPT